MEPGYKEVKPGPDGSWPALVPTYSGRLVRIHEHNKGLEGELSVVIGEGYDPETHYQIKTGNEAITSPYTKIRKLAVSMAVEKDTSENAKA